MEMKRRIKSTLATKQKNLVAGSVVVTQTIIRKYGKHTIELTQTWEDKPIVVEPSVKPRVYKVSKRARLFANVMKKSDVEFIAQMGRDILGE